MGIRMGEPGGGNAPSPRKWGAPGELKHLSTRRKSNQNEIPIVAASEQGRAQTRRLRPSGVEDRQKFITV
jgi:hypothetical protein